MNHASSFRFGTSCGPWAGRLCRLHGSGLLRGAGTGPRPETRRRRPDRAHGRGDRRQSLDQLRRAADDRRPQGRALCRGTPCPRGCLPPGTNSFRGGRTCPARSCAAWSRTNPCWPPRSPSPGALPGITTRLEPGKRAFTIEVDVASGVSGFLRPGDRVDVYWSGRLSLGGIGRDHALIETGLELIAIDQSSEISGRNPRKVANTVTVQVSPQQVANLAQAQATGKLMLSLVGAETTAWHRRSRSINSAFWASAEEEQVVEEEPVREEGLHHPHPPGRRGCRNRDPLHQLSGALEVIQHFRIGGAPLRCAPGCSRVESVAGYPHERCSTRC